MRFIAILTLLSIAVGGCGCRRGRVGQKVDGGASVVVVQRKVPPKLIGGDVELVDEREPDDERAQAQPIEFPKGIRGTIAPAPAGAKRGDTDFYQWLVGGDGKQAARVELSSEGGSEARLALAALDGDGLALVEGELAGDEGARAVVIANLAVEVGKTYYFEVRERGSKEGAAATGIPYRLVVRSTPLSAGDEEEPNDTLPRASAMVAGTDETGYFGRTKDQDFLRLPAELPDGGTLRIELSTPSGVAAGLRLREVAGPTLADARGAKGEELRLRNAPPAPAGTIVLRAESGKNVDEKWTLRVVPEEALAGAETEPNDTVVRANPVDVDAAQASGTLAGFLWPGDVDVFRLRASGVGMLRIAVAPPEHVDMKLERLGASGETVERADAGGAGKMERLAPLRLVGADVIVRVSARPHDTAFDAPYTLTWSVSPADGGMP